MHQLALLQSPMPTRQKVRRILLLGFMFLFPVTFNYYSPYLPIAGTLERVAAFSLLFWAAWMLASLVLGRSACGYICPLGGFQELWDWAVDRKLKRVHNLSILKYAVFALWVGGIAAAALHSGGWDRVNLLYNTPSGISWDSPGRVVIYAGMFGLVLLLCLPLGRRAFCHYLCWWAPLNTIGTKLAKTAWLPALRLAASSDTCIHCHTCTEHCPMSLPVEAMVAKGRMANTECILCGTCVDNCGSEAIKYSWKAPRRA